MLISIWLPFPLTLPTAAATPIPVPDLLELATFEERVINVLANDADNNSDALPLRLVSIDGARLGTATPAHPDSIRFKAFDKPGTDTIIYIVGNARGEHLPGHVTVVIKEGGSCS